VGLKLNGIYHLLVYGHHIDTIKKITEALVGATKEAGLEENAEKTKCMLLSRHQIAWKNQDIKIRNRVFKNVAHFKWYSGTIVPNQNLIQEEIMRRLNSGNACYHSVQNLLSSSLLSKNVNN
jgi:hypothetical protein